MNGATPPLLFESVEVVYRGARDRDRVHAIHKMSLALEPARVTGLVGPNGAGKTTLLELAVGALRPTSGAVLWFGSEAWHGKTRGRIGFCADVPAIPEFLTVREALHFFAGISGSDTGAVGRSIERLELAPLANRRVGALSRGNLVRLGIAQALLHEPEILVLDESLSSLDPDGQRAVRTILREEAARGCAVLLSSHQLDQVERLADGVFMMSGGRISEEFDPRSDSGTLEEAFFQFVTGRDCEGGSPGASLSG